MTELPTDVPSATSPVRATHVSLSNIEVRYGRVVAVRGIDLDVAPGEILALVGPSGCGKTSLLKAIAGLQAIGQGEMSFDGTRIDQLPSHKRGVGMVFQNYALFPHMTVRENVGFGLRLKGSGQGAPNRAGQVAHALEMLRIAHLADAWPDQLSGGQQQRVALARTLVLEPRVLLLDEPLSALDRQLRDAMRSEIRQLVKEVGITTMLVTHDQEEALSMADRIAVMRNGAIEQVGSPRDLFNAPRTAFVAHFIGRSNVLQAVCVNADGKVVLASIGDARIQASWPNHTPAPAPGDALSILVRPDGLNVRVHQASALAAIVADQLFMGDKTELRLRLPDGQILRAEIAADMSSTPVGSTVGVFVNPLRAFAFPTGEAR